MAAYLQMGHDSENLVGETGLEDYRGVILSPVNRDESQLIGDVRKFRAKSEYDIVLDPQLYFPEANEAHYRHNPTFREISTLQIFPPRIGGPTL